MEDIQTKLQDFYIDYPSLDGFSINHILKLDVDYAIFKHDDIKKMCIDKKNGISYQDLYKAMKDVEGYCVKNWTVNTRLLPSIAFTLLKNKLNIP